MEKKIGIMGAMREEIEGLLPLLQDPVMQEAGMRTYYSGKINSIPVVVVFSRWGKVAAAATVSQLILHFGITELLFTGVAGGIDPACRIGDIVIGKRFVQHDMDARPIMERFEIPLLSKTWFECLPERVENARQSIQSFLASGGFDEVVGEQALRDFKISRPSVLVGDIASGDHFFSGRKEKEDLQTILPGLLCVEMEGAAVAQVCYEYAIPFTIVRTISDTSDDQSHIDFPAFVGQVASRASVAIIRGLL